MFGIIATLKAKAGKGTELFAAAQARSAAVRENEEGCMQHKPFVSADDPDTIIFMEEYASQEALEPHRKSEPHEHPRRCHGAVHGRPPDRSAYEGLERANLYAKQ